MNKDYYWYNRLSKLGYKDQIDEIINQNNCDIDPSFLGFLDTYYYLSKIIPKHRIVIDLGCSYGIQAAFFEKHLAYIGVDVSDCLKLKTKKSLYITKTIDDYIKVNGSFENQNLFVICNYVPTSTKLLRETFPYLYVFYPERADNPEIWKAEKKLVNINQ
jgi:hypothetical protein